MSFSCFIGTFKKLFIKYHPYSILGSHSYGEESLIWVKDFYENPWEFYGWIFDNIFFWIRVWRQYLDLDYYLDLDLD